MANCTRSRGIADMGDVYHSCNSAAKLADARLGYGSGPFQPAYFGARRLRIVVAAKPVYVSGICRHPTPARNSGAPDREHA